MNLYFTISGFKTFNNVLFVIIIATFFIPFKQKYTFLRLMLRKSKKESLVAGNHYSIKTTSKGNHRKRLSYDISKIRLGRPSLLC